MKERRSVVQRSIEEPGKWGRKPTASELLPPRVTTARVKMLDLRENVMGLFQIDPNMDQSKITGPEWVISQSKRKNFALMERKRDLFASNLKLVESAVETMFKNLEGMEPIATDEESKNMLNDIHDLHDYLVQIRTFAEESNKHIEQALAETKRNIESEKYMKHLSEGGERENYKPTPRVIALHSGWDNRARKMSAPATRLLTYLDEHQVIRNIKGILDEVGPQ